MGFSLAENLPSDVLTLSGYLTGILYCICQEKAQGISCETTSENLIGQVNS